jgi:hypothetical protein
MNGHVITDRIASKDDVIGKFCDECGKPTIIRCGHCKTYIQGAYFSPYVVDLTNSYIPPKFCNGCGKPFPWTELKLNAVKELVELEDNLDNKNKEILIKSFDDIISENPKTKVAAMKVKLLLAKAGKETARALRDIVVDIASETAQKIIIKQLGQE